jgi:hypothetical protein
MGLGFLSVRDKKVHRANRKTWIAEELMGWHEIYKVQSDLKEEQDERWTWKLCRKLLAFRPYCSYAQSPYSLCYECRSLS